MLDLRVLRVAAFCSVSAFAAMGCSATAGDLEASAVSAAELTTFGPGECATPTVTSAAMLNAAGQPIFGTARTNVNGCIVGRTDETGASVLSRASVVLADPAKIAMIKDNLGALIFSRFAPLPPTGTLATGLVQDVDVTLNLQFSPTTRLRITQRQATAGEPLSIAITNITPVQAVVFFTVTAVKAKNLSLDVQLNAEGNGITVAGKGEVTLEQQKERAAETAALVSQLFTWLTTEIARP